MYLKVGHVVDLEQEASSPQTRPARLQELANNYPRLRPLIAMNPATYPALVQWLGTLDDPSVNVALAQRDALNQVGSSGPQRVSVMGRDYAENPRQTTPADTSPGASKVATAATPTEVAADAPEVTAQPGVAAATRTSNMPLVALAVALVALVVLAFVAYRLLTPSPTPAAEETGVAEITSSEEQSPSEEEVSATEDSESDEAAEVAPEVPRFPAPSSALALNLLVSPSGNIACSLDEEVVTCTINSYGFVSEEMQTCGAGPLTISADREKSAVDCAAPTVQSAGATTLAYEQFAANGNTACRSTENGVACWNTMTGVGFGIARSGYQISLDGPIDPQKFPWG